MLRLDDDMLRRALRGAKMEDLCVEPDLSGQNSTWEEDHLLENHDDTWSEEHPSDDETKQSNEDSYDQKDYESGERAMEEDSD